MERKKRNEKKGNFDNDNLTQRQNLSILKRLLKHIYEKKYILRKQHFYTKNNNSKDFYKKK